MTLTSTAIGFSLLSLGLLFCGLRFFSAFQKIGDSRAGSKTGILLSTMFFSNAITVGILGAAALFFARDSETLFRFFLVSDIPLLLTAILGIYLIFYILFPSVSPWPAVAAVSALGTSVVILTVITHPLPFMDASGGINWNTPRILAVPLSYLIFIHIASPLVIFTHAFLHTKSREVKIISMIQVVLASAGIMNISVRFLLPEGIAFDFVRTRVSDILFASIGLILIGVFVFPPILIKRVAMKQNENP